MVSVYIQPPQWWNHLPVFVGRRQVLLLVCERKVGGLKKKKASVGIKCTPWCCTISTKNLPLVFNFTGLKIMSLGCSLSTTGYLKARPFYNIQNGYWLGL
jgi:hypothetical protein